MWVLYEAASVRTSGKNSEVALSSCPAPALAVPYLSRWETAKKRFAPPVTSFQIRHGNGDLEHQPRNVITEATVKPN